MKSNTRNEIGRLLKNTLYYSEDNTPKKEYYNQRYGHYGGAPNEPEGIELQDFSSLQQEQQQQRQQQQQQEQQELPQLPQVDKDSSLLPLPPPPPTPPPPNRHCNNRVRDWLNRVNDKSNITMEDYENIIKSGIDPNNVFECIDFFKKTGENIDFVKGVNISTSQSEISQLAEKQQQVDKSSEIKDFYYNELIKLKLNDIADEYLNFLKSNPTTEEYNNKINEISKIIREKYEQKNIASTPEEPYCGPGTLDKEACDLINGCEYTSNGECLPTGYEYSEYGLAESTEQQQPNDPNETKFQFTRHLQSCNNISMGDSSFLTLWQGKDLEPSGTVYGINQTIEYKLNN